MFEFLNSNGGEPLRDETLIAVVVILMVASILLLWFKYRMVGSKTRGNNSNENVDSLDVSPSLSREWRMTSRKDLTKLDKNEIIHPVTFKKFTILEITQVTENTKLFRLEIPFGEQLGVSIGRHITVRADINGQKVMRAYTPTSRPDQQGYFEIMIKKYEYGKLSLHFHTLNVGDSIMVRGPIGRFKYTKNKHARIGLIAGGTGLTPCLQMIRCILEGSEYSDDETCFTLFFQNRTEDDILLEGVLNGLIKKFPSRLAIVYFCSNPVSPKFEVSPSYESVVFHIKSKTCISAYRRGYIDAEAMKSLMAPCGFVCMCGPSGFTEAMKKLLLTNTDHVEDGNDPSIYIW